MTVLFVNGWSVPVFIRPTKSACVDTPSLASVNNRRTFLLHERTTTAKNMGILKYHQTSLISYERLAPGMPRRSYQTKPCLPSGCQVNIKRFYAKSTCQGSNYRNISSLTLVQKVIPGYFSSLTLVQKVIPGYLQRTVDNYSRAYLWLISHDLSHGVLLMYNLQ
jgi:hypothetical protein